MTKYRLSADPDTGKPCMVADPDGIYYSAGEVDREIHKRTWLMQRLAWAIDENWEDMRSIDGIEKLMIEAEAYVTGISRNLNVGFGLIEFQPFPEPLPCKTHIEGEWIDEAGTHDGGTVSEGDGSSTGPASARDSEGDSE